MIITHLTKISTLSYTLNPLSIIKYFELSYLSCTGGWTRTSKRINQSAYEADAITTSAHTGIYLYPKRDSNSHAFQHSPLKRACLPFHHLGIVVAGAGFEPDVSLAQPWVMSPVSLTSTLPRDLYLERDSNPHALLEQGILSPSCLPFHHPGR